MWNWGDRSRAENPSTVQSEKIQYSFVGPLGKHSSETSPVSTKFLNIVVTPGKNVAWAEWLAWCGKGHCM